MSKKSTTKKKGKTLSKERIRKTAKQEAVQREAKKHQSVIHYDLVEAMKREHDLEITEIESIGFSAGDRMWMFKCSDGSEWKAVESEEGAEALAKEQIIDAFTDLGLTAAAKWVIEDNLDKKAMLLHVDEYLENELESGGFKTREDAERFYQDMIDDPSARTDWFSDKELRGFVNTDGLAEDIIRHDGLGQILGGYDGSTWETSNGVVYWRIE